MNCNKVLADRNGEFWQEGKKSNREREWVYPEREREREVIYAVSEQQSAAAGGTKAYYEEVQ